MRIGVTGDTHGDLNFKRIFQAKRLEYDLLIICGDFGYIWNGSLKEQRQLDYLNKIGVKVLFVDGNHENFNVLNEYPVSEMYGGKVQIIRDNIVHLMRGEYYTIDNKTFWCMGGANSTDKEYRVEGKSWWKEELPSENELQYGIDNLKKHNNKVDYILTHASPSNMLKYIGGEYRKDALTTWLQWSIWMNTFGLSKKWFAGHMHIDFDIIDKNFKFIYRDIEELK